MHVAHLGIDVDTDRDSGTGELLGGIVLCGEKSKPSQFDRTIRHAVKAVDLVFVVFPRTSDGHGDV